MPTIKEPLPVGDSKMEPEPQLRPLSAGFQKRARLAAILVGSGLVVEAASLPWAHPLAFLSMTGIGVALVVGGAFLYVWAEVSR